ncbi:unnamed protein product [Pleuronectes platessa]|uniref:Uncharacterized protein n=1 Tax=Pleuronectes platessa TaxID=8262 RepID=A0A9N7VJL1_PLEPL|nr:unnamed protein product [Pleuronectes platessa]
MVYGAKGPHASVMKQLRKLLESGPKGLVIDKGPTSGGSCQISQIGASVAMMAKKKEGARYQSQTDRETRNNGNASSSETRSENGDDTEDETAPATLSSLRRVVSEVVAAGMRDNCRK